MSCQLKVGLCFGVDEESLHGALISFAPKSTASEAASVRRTLSSTATLPITRSGDFPRRRRDIVITRILERASYANVMATIAVFLALGGTGYAPVASPQ
jgi:hypothetical protein